MLRFKRPDGSEYPEWENKMLTDVADYMQGLTYSPDNVSDNGTIVLRSSNIQNDRIDYTDIVKVDVEIPDKLKLKENDALICVRNGSQRLVGKTALITKDDLHCTWGAFMNIVRSKNGGKFIYYYLNSEHFRKHIFKDVSTATIFQITSKMLGACKLTIPCLEEQQEIADCLSSVDAVIADFEAQVENMQNQKKGVMQKLFSQEVRFMADDGSEYPEWDEMTLESVGDFYGGLSGKTKEDFGKGNGRFITYMNVYKNAFSSHDMLESVDVGVDEHQNTVSYGDILMSQSSETVEEVGLSSVYLFDDKPYLNSFCFGIHLRDHSITNPMYMGFLMRSEAVRKQIMREGQGISRINLSPNRIRTVLLGIPCLEEQQKIADCLTAFDEAIEDLQKTVEHWKNIKKGLLQQLFA